MKNIGKLAEHQCIFAQGHSYHIKTIIFRFVVIFGLPSAIQFIAFDERVQNCMK